MKNDGGSAFPRSGYESKYPNSNSGPSSGMSLRDWFAGMALQGLLNADHYYSPNLEKRLGTKDYAGDAYQLADAMIEQSVK